MLEQLILTLEENPPEANDVVAGWTGLFLLLALVAAVAFLGWSLTKQLKKADKAAADGVYDDPAEPRGPDAGPDGSAAGGSAADR